MKLFKVLLAGVAILGGAKIAFAVTIYPGKSAVFQPSPTSRATVSSSPTPTASDTSSPSPPQTSLPVLGSGAVVDLLNTLEKPELALETDWKKTIARTLLTGQVTSVVFKTATPCAFANVAGVSKMMPVSIAQASAPGYKTGTYYDALYPLTSTNCSGSVYLQLDINSSVQLGDAIVSITHKATQAPLYSPKVNLNVEFNNWTMVRGYCGGIWCKAEDRGPQGTQVLKDHRISSYKTLPASSSPYEIYAGPYQLGLPFVAYGDYEVVSSAPTNGWVYVLDEPKYDDDATMLSRLQNWAANSPTRTRMVTTPIRRKDLKPLSPTFAKVIDYPPDIVNLIQIFAPVAEEFCVETWPRSEDFYPCREDYTGKQLWLYVSNMAHGSESGNATGSPDLVIDRPAVEAFGFYLLAVKYDLDGLLYYNSIEGWQNATKDFLCDPYQLGGNGDGLLLYPDRKAKIAYPSYRLKLLREASQWADIVILGGKKEEASALMTNPLSWQRDLAAFEAVRAQALANLP